MPPSQDNQREERAIEDKAAIIAVGRYVMPLGDQGDFHFRFAESSNAATLITLALAEDFGDGGDLTARLVIPDDAVGLARFVARSAGVMAGMPVVSQLFSRVGVRTLTPYLFNGDRLEPGALIASVRGPMRTLLAVERTALNFLQRLSGIATLTARFVAEVAGTKAVILDTRKTTPGWRALEKYAVRCGGGTNHRIGLYDAVLIKDNHLAWLGGGRRPDRAGARGGESWRSERDQVHRGRGRHPRTVRPGPGSRSRHHTHRQPRSREAGRGCSSAG